LIGLYHDRWGKALRAVPGPLAPVGIACLWSLVTAPAPAAISAPHLLAAKANPAAVTAPLSDRTPPSGASGSKVASSATTGAMASGTATAAGSNGSNNRPMFSTGWVGNKHVVATGADMNHKQDGKSFAQEVTDCVSNGLDISTRGVQCRSQPAPGPGVARPVVTF